MELACPNCKTVFSVADNAIGPNGRKVRCSNCGHTWQAEPAKAAKGAPAAQVASTPMAIPSDDEFHWPSETASESAPLVAEAAAPKSTTSEEKTASGYSPPISSAIEDGDQSRQKRGSGLLVLGVVLLVIVAATYFLRDGIVAAIPQTAAVFRMAGIPVAQSRNQLSFEDVRFGAADSNSGSVVRVTGFIKNAGQGPVSVPSLVVTLTANDGTIMTRQEFPPPQPVIEPHKPARFQYNLDGDAEAVGAVQVHPAGTED